MRSPLGPPPQCQIATLQTHLQHCCAHQAPPPVPRQFRPMRQTPHSAFREFLCPCHHHGPVARAASSAALGQIKLSLSVLPSQYTCTAPLGLPSLLPQTHAGEFIGLAISVAVLAIVALSINSPAWVCGSKDGNPSSAVQVYCEGNTLRHDLICPKAALDAALVSGP